MSPITAHPDARLLAPGLLRRWRALECDGPGIREDVSRIYSP